MVSFYSKDYFNGDFDGRRILTQYQHEEVLENCADWDDTAEWFYDASYLSVLLALTEVFEALELVWFVWTIIEFLSAYLIVVFALLASLVFFIIFYF